MGAADAAGDEGGPSALIRTGNGPMSEHCRLPAQHLGDDIDDDRAYDSSSEEHVDERILDCTDDQRKLFDVIHRWVLM